MNVINYRNPGRMDARKHRHTDARADARNSILHNNNLAFWWLAAQSPANRKSYWKIIVNYHKSLHKTFISIQDCAYTCIEVNSPEVMLGSATSILLLDILVSNSTGEVNPAKLKSSRLRPPLRTFSQWRTTEDSINKDSCQRMLCHPTLKKT